MVRVGMYSLYNPHFSLHCLRILQHAGFDKSRGAKKGGGSGGMGTHLLIALLRLLEIQSRAAWYSLVRPMR